MKKSIFLIAALLSIFTSVIAQSITYADSGSYCQSKYSQASNPKYKACVFGYEHGNPSNPVCAKSFTSTVDGVNASDLQRACVDGYGQYNKDKDACNDSSCVDSLRPTNTPITGSPSNNPPPPDPNDAPVPSSADIKNLKGDGGMDHTECGIETFFGHVVCSFTKMASRIADVGFNLLSLFLKTPPIVNGPSSPIYNAWVQFRDIANVVFVIAFIIVIYSQLTGLGISNYNIKRMLPRLIVAAILINVSYYMCMLAVDLSNILGATLTNAMTEIVPPADHSGSGLSGWQQAIGTVLALGGPAIAAGAALLYLDLSMIIPVLATVVIVLAVTIITIIIRQALIIIFIVISPLAMAAIILPNTRQWFDKWKNIFIPVLMLYPSIALVFGASKIASEILQRVGESNNNALLIVASLGIQIIPLVMVPSLMKMGGNILSNAQGKISNNKVTQGAKKKSDEYAKYRGDIRTARAVKRPINNKRQKFIRGINKPRDATVRRKANREAVRESLDMAHKSVAEDYAIDEMSNESTTRLGRAKETISRGRFRAKTAGEKYSQNVAATKDKDSASIAKARAVKKKVSAHAQKVKAQAQILERSNLSGSELKTMALEGVDVNGNEVSAIQKQAAILRVTQLGDVNAIFEISQNSASLTNEQRKQLMDGSQSNGSVMRKAPFLANATARDNVQQGIVNKENFSVTVVAPSLVEDDWSPETMTGLDTNGAQAVIDAVENVPVKEMSESTSTPLSEQDVKDVEQAAYDALHEKRTESAVAGGRAHLEILAEKHTNRQSNSDNTLQPDRTANQQTTPPPTTPPNPRSSSPSSSQPRRGGRV